MNHPAQRRTIVAQATESQPAPTGSLIDTGECQPTRASRASLADHLTTSQFLARVQITCVTLALNAGAPIGIISKAAGHSSISVTTDIYGSLQIEGQRLVADAIERSVRFTGI